MSVEKLCTFKQKKQTKTNSISLFILYSEVLMRIRQVMGTDSLNPLLWHSNPLGETKDSGTFKFRLNESNLTASRRKQP